MADAAGALDCLGRRESDGKLVVVDFKTTNQLVDSYALQLAAYAHAYMEMHAGGSKEGTRADDADDADVAEVADGTVVGALAVRIDKKTGAVEEKEVADLDLAFHGFKAALLLWRLQNSDGLFRPRAL